MDTFYLFRANKRLTLRPEDMTTEKLSVIFQVQRESVYLTDESNVAIFPRADGDFNCFELISRAHYEVHGDSIDKAVSTPPAQRFSFHRPPSAASASFTGTPRASVVKTFVRNVFIGDIVNGKLESNKMVTVRFTEFEACVSSILSKVKDAVGQQGPFTLTDSHGNEIVDSEGTRGSTFWKQNSRKVFAVLEEQVMDLQGSKRKRQSRREDTGLHDLMIDIEEVIEAAQGLKDVSRIIKDVSESVCFTFALTEADVSALKAGFACLICKDRMVRPMFSTCCKSLIGCKECVAQWKTTSDYCPKCRGDDLVLNCYEVAGLAEALTPLEKVFN